MELREVATDVYACLQPDRGLGTSNSGLVDRGGGLVVDTFWDLPHTRQLIETYARVWKAPIRRIVNTHHNGDHCWGNQLFPAAEIIGHRLCAASFGKERPEVMQMLKAAAGSDDAAGGALPHAPVGLDQAAGVRQVPEGVDHQAPGAVDEAGVARAEAAVGLEAGVDVAAELAELHALR